MSLPNLPLRKRTIDVGGETVSVRGLSRAEAVQATALLATSVEEMEIFIISVVFGVEIDEAADWYASASQGGAGVILDAVADLSGLDEASGKG